MIGLEPRRRNSPGLPASPGPESPILTEKTPSRTPLDSTDLLRNLLFRCSERCLGGTRRAPLRLNGKDSVGCGEVFLFRRPGLEPMKRLFAMFSRGQFELLNRRMMNSHSMECV